MNNTSADIPAEQLSALLDEVARLYDAPRAECRVVRVTRDRHRDTCDGVTVNGACAACNNDTHYDVITCSYPGARRPYFGNPEPKSFTWHSTWGRVVGSDHEARGTFELYAD